MTGKERNTKLSLGEEDEPVEWPDEVWDRAQISIGGKVIREATGTLARRGRPPVGEAPKQQVTLRLPRHVLDHFKAGGTGWQTRLSEALEDHVSGAGAGQGSAPGPPRKPEAATAPPGAEMGTVTSNCPRIEPKRFSLFPLCAFYWIKIGNVLPFRFADSSEEGRFRPAPE
jgi:hypothetical protein